MAISSALRSKDSATVDFISTEQLFAHFSAIQAQGLTVLPDNTLAEVATPSGSDCR
jgi:cold shock CspA family protein